MTSMRDTNPKNRILSALTEDDFNHLRSNLCSVSLPHKGVLHEQNGLIEHVYFIEEGVASVLTVTGNGAMSEVGMIGTEGVVGVSALLGARTSAQHVIVQVPGVALRMDASRCKAAFDQRPEMQALVLRFVDAFINLSAQTAGCNLRHSAEQRCARWLLMASDRARSNTIPMTHNFLSSMLGIRRTGVTAIAGVFQQSGLIEYRRGLVRLIDRRGLEAAACECYRIDHERLNSLP
jgi:CRP-like cAMP-binding protein